MITQQEFEAAKAQMDAAQKVINAFTRQKLDNSKERWDRFCKGEAPYTDEELRYSAGARCRCGAGLAYPKECPPNHQWSCSAVLKGGVKDDEHEAYPFAFYEIKSEDQPSAQGHTTRPKVES